MSEKEVKKYSIAEVRERADANKPWMVINDSIYDVTEFLNDHPVGEEVLLEQAGKDASEEFEDVGHLSDARELMQKYKIGKLIEDKKQNKKPVNKPKPASSNEPGDEFRIWKSWLLHLTLGVLAIFVYRYFIASLRVKVI